MQARAQHPTTKNQITGFCYDAAGNLLRQGACGTSDYAYDGENRMTAALGAAYAYDPDGNRARKNVGGAWTEYLYFGGNPVAERDQTGTWTEYVFFGGWHR